MVNTVSGIKMANQLKSMVSKQRIRYTDDGFNLDLAYITDNIIAMGFPANNVEGIYRNNIDEVIRFLKLKHDNVYRIYNLCSERSYEKAKFQNATTFPFPDHNPPSIELMQEFCKDMEKWLQGDKHVAAVHCKAGKGRTGTMICCYLLHCGRCKTADDALKFYGHKRARDEKGVTIPSQRRYVEYFEYLEKHKIIYKRLPLKIKYLKLRAYNGNHSGTNHCKILVSTTAETTDKGCYMDNALENGCNTELTKVYSDILPEVKKSDSEPDYIKIDVNSEPVSGEVKVEFNGKLLKKKFKVFHFWFNTLFAKRMGSEQSDGTVMFKLTKSSIDDAHKDKQCKSFPKDFYVEVYLESVSKNISQHNNHVEHSNHTNGASTKDNTEMPTQCGSSIMNSDSDWESGEPKILRPQTRYNDDNYFATNSTFSSLKKPGLMAHNCTKKSSHNHSADYADMEILHKASLAGQCVRSPSVGTIPQSIKQPHIFNATNNNTTTSNTFSKERKNHTLVPIKNECGEFGKNIEINPNTIPMRNSNDSIDLPSALCDKLLSVGSSPAKSLRFVDDRSGAQLSDPPKPSIVIANCDIKANNIGFVVADQQQQQQRTSSVLDDALDTKSSKSVSSNTGASAKPKNECNGFKNKFLSHFRKDYTRSLDQNLAVARHSSTGAPFKYADKQDIANSQSGILSQNTRPKSDRK